MKLRDTQTVKSCNKVLVHGVGCWADVVLLDSATCALAGEAICGDTITSSRSSRPGGAWVSSSPRRGLLDSRATILGNTATVDEALGARAGDGHYELRVELDFSPTAPRVARRRVATWLSDVACSESTKADAVLVVSELVTNAILHGRSAPILTATFDDGRLRLEVEDSNTASPQQRLVTDHRGGYGLHIVAQISDAWGARSTPNGKVVWTEMLC